MNLSLDLVAVATGVIALLIGIWLGMALRGGAKKRAVLFEERLRVTSAERDQILAERDALRTERDSLDERLRPLAAELDRMKRAETRRVAPVVDAPAATARVVPDGALVEELDANDPRRLKGVGDRFAASLGKLGVTGIDQIAGWTGADADVIDSQLGSFAGRIRTDRLVEQARLLHEGRLTEYETRFGAL